MSWASGSQLTAVPPGGAFSAFSRAKTYFTHPSFATLVEMEDGQREQVLVPSEVDLSVPSAIPIRVRNRGQAWLITWALITSNLFALLVTFVFEFLSLRGVVHLAASRIVLGLAWATGEIMPVSIEECKFAADSRGRV
jgi:hypothetical protein